MLQDSTHPQLSTATAQQLFQKHLGGRGSEPLPGSRAQLLGSRTGGSFPQSNRESAAVQDQSQPRNRLLASESAQAAFAESGVGIAEDLGHQAGGSDAPASSHAGSDEQDVRRKRPDQSPTSKDGSAAKPRPLNKKKGVHGSSALTAHEQPPQRNPPAILAAQRPKALSPQRPPSRTAQSSSSCVDDPAALRNQAHVERGEGSPIAEENPSSNKNGAHGSPAVTTQQQLPLHNPPSSQYAQQRKAPALPKPPTFNGSSGLVRNGPAAAETQGRVTGGGAEPQPGTPELVEHLPITRAWEAAGKT